jgi:hypothetical protein
MTLQSITTQIRAFLIKRYIVEHNTAVCLVCGGSNFAAASDPIQNGKGHLKRPMRCFDCGAVWNDLLILQGVGDIDLTYVPSEVVGKLQELYVKSSWE